MSTNLTKVKSNTTDLENLVHKLGTPEDCEPLRDRYLRLQNETKALLQQLNGDIKKLSGMRVTTEDETQKKNFLKTVSDQYLAIINRFQEAQRLGVRKEKESLDRTRAVTYRQSGVDNSQFEDDSPSSNSQFQGQVVLPMEQAVDMQGLRERDDQLRQLETNIVLVSELFNDVAQMVHEHGEIIDTIEIHTEQTVKNVEIANTQLIKAVDYQTAARRKKIMLIALLLIILLILGLILGIYFGTKK